MTKKKKLFISILTALAFSILIIAALLITWRTLKISYNMNETVVSIDSKITITRDENGIPRIDASTYDDIYFALGYIHAKDRLDLIELNRGLSTGNSSSFITVKNEGALFDALSRTIGFTRKADEIIASLSDDHIKLLESYCAGINHIRSGRPSSYLHPADWTPRDVISVLLMKEWCNSFLNNPELAINISSSVKKTPGVKLPGKKYTHYYSESEASNLNTIRRIKSLIEKYTGYFNRGLSLYIDSALDKTGSNNYSTFTYYDHYSSYPGWYPVKILINNTSSDTITFSGMPFMFAYKNSFFTMVHFNMNADTQDFILIRADERDNEKQYNLNGSWRDFTTVRTPVKAADGSDINEIVWVTEKGPAFNETAFNPDGTVRMLVIQSVLPGAGYLRFLMDGPFSDSASQIKKSITENDGALKCFLVSSEKECFKAYSGYVSKSPDENIFKYGIRLNRSGFQKFSFFKTRLMADYIASDSLMPGELRSIAAMLITNDLKTRRIIQLLEPRQIYSDEKIAELIADRKSESASMFTPVFKALLETNPLTSATLSKIYLNDWNYEASYNMQAPSIFYTTFHQFINNTLMNEFGSDAEYNMDSAYLLYEDFLSIITGNDQVIYDIPETENIEIRETLFDISFFNSMRILNRKSGPLMEKWTWSEIFSTKFTLPRIKYNLIYRFYKVDDMPFNGGPDTISSSTFDHNFIPVSGTSLNGYMNSSTFKFSMNTGYSTSVLSEFFYGKTLNIPLTEIGKISSLNKTILNRE